MKKILFMLAFMLISTVSFAENDLNKKIKTENKVQLDIDKIITAENSVNTKVLFFNFNNDVCRVNITCTYQGWAIKRRLVLCSQVKATVKEMRAKLRALYDEHGANN